MTVSSIGANSSSTASTAAASTTSASSALNLDFTQYLQILTTQLKNQDPTNATDPNQFTQELVQIEQVQQQITTNTDLQNLTTATSANGLATGISYIGNYVEAPSSSGDFEVQGGASEFGYTLASAAGTTTITIKDSSGDTVATLNGGTAAGSNYVTWDGTDASGTQLADGMYTFTVNATDNNGAAVTSGNNVALTKITSVQNGTDGALNLIASDVAVSSSDVTALYTPSTLPTGTKGVAYTPASSS